MISDLGTLFSCHAHLPIQDATTNAKLGDCVTGSHQFNSGRRFQSGTSDLSNPHSGQIFPSYVGSSGNTLDVTLPISHKTQYGPVRAPNTSDETISTRRDDAKHTHRPPR